MIRHEALHPLSRDHAVGLLLARRLMREDAADELLSGWDLALEDHFIQEEQLLGPLIADPLINERLMDDHRAFEALVAKIQNGNRAPEIQCEAGALLDEHIHWEERVLFPHIEAVAGPDALRDLEAKTDEIERSRWDGPLEPNRGRIVSNRLRRLRGG